MEWLSGLASVPVMFCGLMCLNAVALAVVGFRRAVCSVADQAAVSADARQVLRPGSELRLDEHVIDAEPRFARFQRWSDRIYSCAADGCHVSRDTETAIVDAGFNTPMIRRFGVGSTRLAAPTAATTHGAAHAPTS